MSSFRILQEKQGNTLIGATTTKEDPATLTCRSGEDNKLASAKSLEDSSDSREGGRRGALVMSLALQRG